MNFLHLKSIYRARITLKKLKRNGKETERKRKGKGKEIERKKKGKKELKILLYKSLGLAVLDFFKSYYQQKKLRKIAEFEAKKKVCKTFIVSGPIGGAE